MALTAIIDYGMGNLDSITRGVQKCGGTPVRCTDAAKLMTADRAILPGVGAFPKAMINLRERGLIDAIHEFARSRPLLGVCLGMQLLAKRGTEIEDVEGLGLIDGTVERLNVPAPLRIPHIGWNSVDHTGSDPLFAGIASATDFYFVHSYQFVCDDPSNVIATAPYGAPVTAAVRAGHLCGVQFHPEKSQQGGLRLLKNFLAA